MPCKSFQTGTERGDPQNTSLRSAEIRSLREHARVGCMFIFVLALLFGAGGGSAIISSMITGPFFGWISATIVIYLLLIPGERRLA